MPLREGRGRAGLLAVQDLLVPLKRHVAISELVIHLAGGKHGASEEGWLHVFHVSDRVVGMHGAGVVAHSTEHLAEAECRELEVRIGVEITIS